MNVSKTECISIFNEIIRGSPNISLEKHILLISEYLTENNIENSDKLINLIVQQPQLIKIALPKVIDYFCKKYNILILKSNFNKIILYYE